MIYVIPVYDDFFIKYACYINHDTQRNINYPTYTIFGSWKKCLQHIWGWEEHLTIHVLCAHAY